MEELVGLIANVGFPIVISVYLLVRIENQLKNLDQSIQDLTHTIHGID
ncbi:YvrJ family protein [Eubacteriales bacterium mix99]|jgi:hypothetical protein